MLVYNTADHKFRSTSRFWSHGTRRNASSEQQWRHYLSRQVHMQHQRVALFAYLTLFVDSSASPGMWNWRPEVRMWPLGPPNFQINCLYGPKITIYKQKLSANSDFNVVAILLLNFAKLFELCTTHARCWVGHTGVCCHWWNKTEVSK